MSLKNYIRKVLVKLINSEIIYNELNYQAIAERLQNNKIESCLSQVTIKDSSRFYGEATVNNMQKNKSKILIGKNTHIRGFLQLFTQGGQIQIGDFCYIGENTKVWSSASITIGNNVLIAHGVNIHDNISHPLNSQQRHEDYKRILGLSTIDANTFDLRGKPIIIKDNVWIGFNTTILKGVTIGEGSIIGAESFITKDVPDWTIVAGNPARVIREIPLNER